MRRIHPTAETGFSHSGAVYERGRPSYPDSLLFFLRKELGIRDGARVLDLGAGTGKFTRLLVRSGAKIDAVEPLEDMRRNFQVDEARVVDGTAESIPFPDNTFDAVAVAQAFHWFDHAQALPEIHRVLKPAGQLLLVWNSRDNRTDWVAHISGLLEPIQRSVPDHSGDVWNKAIAESGLFDGLEQRVFEHHHVMTREIVRARFASASYVAMLPDEDREELLTKIDEVVRNHPATAGRDTFSMPYITELFWTRAL